MSSLSKLSQSSITDHVYRMIYLMLHINLLFLCQKRNCINICHPPDEFHYVQLRKVFYLPIDQSWLQFCVMNIERLKGGEEYNILQFCDCGVYCMVDLDSSLFSTYTTPPPL